MRHQNIVFHALLKHVPWALFDTLVEEFEADGDPRAVKAKAHLVAMLYAQFGCARSLRDIETGLRSPASKLYHLGGSPVSRSTLATANGERSADVFGALLSALMAQLQRGYRGKIADCIRLIDPDQI